MSIVNHSRGFIFVHIPKCGGTFLTAFLAQFTTYRDLEIGGTRFGEGIQPFYERRFGLRKHSSAAEIMGVVGVPRWNEFVTFSVMRNPYRRSISTYHFLKKWKNWPKSEVMAKFNGPNDFILSDYWQTEGVDNILRTQAAFLRVTEPAAKPIDRIFRLEALSLAEIASALGIASEECTFGDGYNRNTSSAAPGQSIDQLLSGRSIEAIAARYKDDFDLGGYSADPTLA